MQDTIDAMYAQGFDRAAIAAALGIAVADVPEPPEQTTLPDEPATTTTRRSTIADVVRVAADMTRKLRYAQGAGRPLGEFRSTSVRGRRYM